MRHNQNQNSLLVKSKTIPDQPRQYHKAQIINLVAEHVVSVRDWTEHEYVIDVVLIYC